MQSRWPTLLHASPANFSCETWKELPGPRPASFDCRMLQILHPLIVKGMVRICGWMDQDCKETQCFHAWAFLGGVLQSLNGGTVQRAFVLGS